MTLKQLREINSLIGELWDFFTTNSDGDETNLREDVGIEYSSVKRIIQEEFYKIHLRNELQKERNKIKNP